MEQGDIETTSMSLTEDSILREIEQLENLKSEAVILTEWSGSSSFMDNINALQNQWNNLLIAYRKSKDGEITKAAHETSSEDLAIITEEKTAEQIQFAKPSAEEVNNNAKEQIVPSTSTTSKESAVLSESDAVQVEPGKPASVKESENDMKELVPSAIKSEESVVPSSDSNAEKKDEVTEANAIEPEVPSTDSPTQEVIDA